ncbi:hypothetical protein BBOV_III006145 [Babesia bovis T2Bo]|uniref:hypothetical protein n=1 Tax=Babesia bovis T2Bo TaxID=484906 RepID=UPI001C352E25|nr:hypothetical protein BBOV_III006145 [Babesia bovis T2Bo]KAG6440041.1 hypothetical protein BBOV_III006145 [Babesia bovis T2Bo]
MALKRGQILCSTEPGLPESSYYDEPLRVTHKRHCHPGTPYGISSPLRMDVQAFPGCDTASANEAQVECHKQPKTIRTLVSEWSERIIEGLRNVQSTRDLREPLANYLTHFYNDTCATGSEADQSVEDNKANLENRIERLVQRNTVLQNMVRHQYDTIRQLQAKEALIEDLIKEKTALNDELTRLKECINAYVSSFAKPEHPNPDSMDLQFTRRPPDVY